MSSANVLPPSAPPREGVENYYSTKVQQSTQLYPSLVKNFWLTEISKIEKEIADEVEHYMPVLKTYKKLRK